MAVGFLAPRQEEAESQRLEVAEQTATVTSESGEICFKSNEL